MNPAPPSEEPARQHPLASVEGLTPAQIEALARQWIETAEQLLALAAIPGSRSGLGSLLACSPDEFDTLLARLRAVVGRRSADALERPVAGGALGLRLPPDAACRPPS